jgi:hypothetical protein
MFVTILVYFLGVGMMGNALLRTPAARFILKSAKLENIVFYASRNVKRKRVFRKHE